MHGMMAPMPDSTSGEGVQEAKISPAQAEMHQGMNMDGGKDTAEVRDPVCGMTVDPEKAEEEGLFEDFQGKRYYFCSRECLDDFHRHGPRLGNPMNDMSSPGEMAGQKDHHHD